MSRIGKLVATMALATPCLVPVGAAHAGPSVTCDGQAATIVGTSGRDTLRGTDGNDVIAGLGGDDRIIGLAGRDVICGGGGSDDLRGGPGVDRLFGGADHLYQGFSSGGAEFTYTVGDRLAGGPGDDRLDAGYDSRTNLREQRDRLVFGGRHGVDVHLAAFGSSGSATGEGKDVLVGQSNLAVKGSPGPDTIWGSPYDDILKGATGDDVIRGRDGDDVITDGGNRDAPDRDVLGGGPGMDQLTARFGADVVDGGPGEDQLRGSSVQMVALRGGAGGDRMSYGAVGRGCPEVVGGRGNDQLAVHADRTLSQVTLRIVLDGPIGGCGAVRSIETLLLAPRNHTRWDVVGTDGREQVRAIRNVRVVAHLRGGDDAMLGGNRDDFLVGGPGDDEVNGMDGTDTCRGFETEVSCERS